MAWFFERSAPLFVIVVAPVALVSMPSPKVVKPSPRWMACPSLTPLAPTRLAPDTVTAPLLVSVVSPPTFFLSRMPKTRL